MPENTQTDKNEPDGTVVEGRNALLEALRAEKSIEKLYYLDSASRGGSSLTPIIQKCRESGAILSPVSRQILDRMSQSGAHQGVIAVLSGYEYHTPEELLEKALGSGSPPLLILCDHIEDPGNLGAIVRSAEAAGAQGVIIPKRRGAGLTPAAIKASAGALMHLPVARCANLNHEIKMLKDAGLWVFGADGAAETSVYDADLRGPCAIVLGSEGKGLSRLVRESCDALIKIPMPGRVGSLNVSCAAAALLFEAVRQRGAGRPDKG